MFSLEDTSKKYVFPIVSVKAFIEVRKKLKEMGCHCPGYSYIENRLWGIHYNSITKQWNWKFRPQSWVNVTRTTTKDIIGHNINVKLLDDTKMRLFDKVYYQDDIKELLKAATPIPV